MIQLAVTEALIRMSLLEYSWSKLYILYYPKRGIVVDQIQLSQLAFCKLWRVVELQLPVVVEVVVHLSCSEIHLLADPFPNAKLLCSGKSFEHLNQLYLWTLKAQVLKEKERKHRFKNRCNLSWSHLKWVYIQLLTLSTLGYISNLQEDIL